MKSKKFKLEKKVLEEAKKTLYSYSLRAKLLSSFVAENYVNESFYYLLLSKYQQNISLYFQEIDSILKDGRKSTFIVSQEQVDKLNYYKNILVLLEESISSSNVFNLKVH